MKTCCAGAVLFTSVLSLREQFVERHRQVHGDAGHVLPAEARPPFNPALPRPWRPMELAVLAAFRVSEADLRRGRRECEMQLLGNDRLQEQS
jgi:hypothetical protein